MSFEQQEQNENSVSESACSNGQDAFINTQRSLKKVQRGKKRQTRCYIDYDQQVDDEELTQRAAELSWPGRIGTDSSRTVEPNSLRATTAVGTDADSGTAACISTASGRSCVTYEDIASHHVSRPDASPHHQLPISAGHQAPASHQVPVSHPAPASYGLPRHQLAAGHQGPASHQIPVSHPAPASYGLPRQQLAAGHQAPASHQIPVSHPAPASYGLPRQQLAAGHQGPPRCDGPQHDSRSFSNHRQQKQQQDVTQPRHKFARFSHDSQQQQQQFIEYVDPNVAASEKQAIFKKPEVVPDPTTNVKKHKPLTESQRRKIEKSKKYREQQRIKEEKAREKLEREFMEMAKRPRPPCRYYLKGMCSKADKCTYSHDCEVPKKAELCKFYVIGACTKGSSCIYYHGDWPCKFFHTFDFCMNGDNCKFSHEPLNDETRQILDTINSVAIDGDLVMQSATQIKAVADTSCYDNKGERTVASCANMCDKQQTDIKHNLEPHAAGTQFLAASNIQPTINIQPGTQTSISATKTAGIGQQVGRWKVDTPTTVVHTGTKRQAGSQNSVRAGKVYKARTQAASASDGTKKKLKSGQQTASEMNSLHPGLADEYNDAAVAACDALMAKCTPQRTFKRRQVVRHQLPANELTKNEQVVVKTEVLDTQITDIHTANNSQQTTVKTEVLDTLFNDILTANDSKVTVKTEVLDTQITDIHTANNSQQMTIKTEVLDTLFNDILTANDSKVTVKTEVLDTQITDKHVANNSQQSMSSEQTISQLTAGQQPVINGRQTTGQQSVINGRQTAGQQPVINGRQTADQQPVSNINQQPLAANVLGNFQGLHRHCNNRLPRAGTQPLQHGQLPWVSNQTNPLRPNVQLPRNARLPWSGIQLPLHGKNESYQPPGHPVPVPDSVPVPGSLQSPNINSAEMSSLNLQLIEVSVHQSLPDYINVNDCRWSTDPRILKYTCTKLQMPDVLQYSRTEPVLIPLTGVSATDVSSVSNITDSNDNSTDSFYDSASKTLVIDTDTGTSMTASGVSVTRDTELPTADSNVPLAAPARHMMQHCTGALLTRSVGAQRLTVLRSNSQHQ